MVGIYFVSLGLSRFVQVITDRMGSSVALFSYRMNSDKFRALLRFLNPPKHDYKGRRIQVASSKMLAMTLRSSL